MPRSITRGEFLASSAGIAAASLLRPARAQTEPAAAPASAPAVLTPEKTYDLREFVGWFNDKFEPSLKLSGGAGHYSRTAGGELELYGIADMACCLYTVGRLHPSEKERSEWADAFQQFQLPETGWLREKTPSHNAVHNLAFGLAAMQLLDLVPRNPVVLGPDYEDPKAMLDKLDFKTAVYTQSHIGAGMAAARYNLPALRDKKWFDGYFAACDALLDPRNGMLGKDKPAKGDFDQVGGTFHYYFNYLTFNRLMAYPEARLDATLALQLPTGHWDTSNKTWLTFDGIYLLTRTARQTPHRAADVRAAVHKAFGALMQEMFAPEVRTRAFGGRLPAHSMTCALSTLAECQQYFGSDIVKTDWPLKLVLDRRPFI
jgi:hypothetical protein